MANTNKSSGVGTATRITVSLLVAIVTTIFIFLWDSNTLTITGAPHWIGPFIIMPLIAVVSGFIGNCLIQGLSCGEVEWLNQLQRIAIVPVPFIGLWILLYIFPGMRWPIEGLIQTQPALVRKSISSSFYTFWVCMYTQSVLNGLSQLCP